MTLYFSTRYGYDNGKVWSPLTPIPLVGIPGGVVPAFPVSSAAAPLRGLDYSSPGGIEPGEPWDPTQPGGPLKPRPPRHTTAGFYRTYTREFAVSAAENFYVSRCTSQTWGNPGSAAKVIDNWEGWKKAPWAQSAGLFSASTDGSGAVLYLLNPNVYNQYLLGLHGPDEGVWGQLLSAEFDQYTDSPIADVASVGTPDGARQFILLQDGSPFHNLWHPNAGDQNPWDGWNPAPGGQQLQAQGNAIIVSGAAVPNGDTHWLIVTENAKLFHTIRFANDTWQQTGWQSPSYAGVNGNVAHVTAAGSWDGSVQVMIDTNAEEVFHNIRFANGSWQGWDRVFAGQFTGNELTTLGTPVVHSATANSEGDVMYVIDVSVGAT